MSDRSFQDNVTKLIKFILTDSNWTKEEIKDIAEEFRKVNGIYLDTYDYIDISDMTFSLALDQDIQMSIVTPKKQPPPSGLSQVGVDTADEDVAMIDFASESASPEYINPNPQDEDVATIDFASESAPPPDPQDQDVAIADVAEPNPKKKPRKKRRTRHQLEEAKKQKDKKNQLKMTKLLAELKMSLDENKEVIEYFELTDETDEKKLREHLEMLDSNTMGCNNDILLFSARKGKAIHFLMDILKKSEETENIVTYLCRFGFKYSQSHIYFLNNFYLFVLKYPIVVKSTLPLRYFSDNLPLLNRMSDLNMLNFE